MSIFSLIKKKNTLSKQSVSKLITDRKWTKLHRAISGNKLLTEKNEMSSCSETVESQSPLLLACENNPPENVVSALIQENPTSVFEADSENMLPLHVACGYGASPKVIAELLKANEDAALQKDRYGMLPIHMVCRFYAENALIWNNSKSQIHDALVYILHLLLKAAPSTILEEDCTRRCPIEHALETHMNIDIVKALQEKAEKVQKVRQHLRTIGFYDELNSKHL